MMALWLGFLGCPKPPPPVETIRRPPATIVSERVPLEGPVYWSEPGGLCLDIPEGFVGTTGESPALLELTHRSTGFGLLLRAWPINEPAPERPGFSLLYESDGSFRTVPLLSPSRSATWQSDDETGRMLQAWYSPLGDRTVEVSMVFPPGRSTEGRDLLDPLVRKLCATWHATGEVREN